MLKVDIACMETQVHQMNEIARQLDAISSRVADVNRQLRWNTSINTTVRNSLVSNYNNISRLDNIATGLSRVLSSAVIQYSKAENEAKVYAGAEPNQIAYAILPLPELIDQYEPLVFDGIIDHVMINRILSLLGLVGQQTYDVINSKMFDWEELFKCGVSMFQFLCKGSSTFKDYMRIGNAIGIEEATARWFRDAADLKSLSGHWSIAKNPVTAFVKNFTNTSSPIKRYFKETAEDLIGKNGVGKSVASWAGIVADLAINGVKNKKEQEMSNGSMSTGRVVAETIIETGVDTIMTYAAGAVAASAVAAGAAAVGATVAMPALAITAIGGLVWTGVNAAVEAGTGKSATEHVSDFVCNTADKIGDAAEKATKSVGKWFEDLAFA